MTSADAPILATSVGPVVSVETCSYETERLLVGPWHSPASAEWPEVDLASVVSTMLTEPVTRHLPDPWRGPYSPDRARSWVAERDEESPTLLVIERSAGDAVGLIILYESPAVVDGRSEVRLGYLLAEQAWGSGIGSEMIEGLVRWCREHSTVARILAGVEPDNEASGRLLIRLGFEPAPDDDAGTERTYVLDL